MRRTTNRHFRLFRRYAPLAAIAILTSLMLTRNTDFRVYWYGVSGVFDGSRPAYGPASGLGFPMHYRYAPVTYLLLWPLSRMPLFWAGLSWMLGAWAAAIGAVAVTVRTARLRFTRRGRLAGYAFVLAYVVVCIRSGNVQPYIIAMILAALMLSESHRIWAAFLLALAISFKVWPVFFLPWFLRSGRRLVLVWLLLALFLVWLSPLVLWSPSQYLGLIGEWYRSEFQSATAASEIWYFPGQSLRGVLLRYFTQNDLWLKGFPDVHVLSLAPAAMVHAWQAIATVSYLGVCIAMLRSGPHNRRVWDCLSFALFSVLQPFCLKSSLISLGPAALVAAALYSGTSQAVRDRRDTLARRFFVAACVLSSIGAAMQYKPWLRLLLAWGLDFYAALLLLTALVLWALLPDPAPFASITRFRRGSLAVGRLLRPIALRYRRHLLQSMARDASIAEGVKSEQAALKKHHPFRGRLLEQILSLCSLSVALAAHYPRLTLNWLNASAVLHNLGTLGTLARRSLRFHDERTIDRTHHTRPRNPRSSRCSGTGFPIGPQDSPSGLHRLGRHGLCGATSRSLSRPVLRASDCEGLCTPDSLETGRAVGEVIEYRIVHGKSSRVAGEPLQSLRVRAPSTVWVWILVERTMLHSPEDLLQHEFGLLTSH